MEFLQKNEYEQQKNHRVDLFNISSDLSDPLRYFQRLKQTCLKPKVTDHACCSGPNPHCVHLINKTQTPQILLCVKTE